MGPQLIYKKDVACATRNEHCHNTTTSKIILDSFHNKVLKELIHPKRVPRLWQVNLQIRIQDYKIWAIANTSPNFQQAIYILIKNEKALKTEFAKLVTISIKDYEEGFKKSMCQIALLNLHPDVGRFSLDVIKDKLVNEVPSS